MRRAWLGFVAFALLSQLALGDEGRTTSCAAQFSLRLQTVTARVTPAGALELDVQIRNNGSTPQWIYGNLTYGVWLYIYDSSGAPVQPRVIFEHMPPPPQMSDFLQLRPAHSLTLHDRYQASELGLRPGRYTARIEFVLLPASRSLAISVCSGRLRTPDEVHFEVVE